MKAGFTYSPAFLEHESQFPHPECPERLGAVLDGLREAGVWDAATRVPTRPATLAELGRPHLPEYVEAVLEALSAGGYGNLDPDTFFSSGTHRAALEAAGGTVDLARAVHRREVSWGWALNRPPGHHATPSRPMGFCMFNNIAVAADALIADGDAERVAIFDWDVHHGNGTQDSFWKRDDVLFVSLHQWPHYPGSGLVDQIGEGDASGRTVNFPLPARSSDDDYLYILGEVVLPLFREFRPDHIMVSAGFDAHRVDPLAGMSLETACYREMAGMIREAADALCGGRLTLVLEGGYDLGALRESAVEVVRGIEEGPVRSPGPPAPRPSANAAAVINKVIAAITPHWGDWLEKAKI